MKVRTNFLFLMMVLMILAGCNSETGMPSGTPASENTVTPPEAEQPLSPTPVPDKAKNSPFSLVVKNALLFNARVDPFTRNLSRESGVCLMVVGAVKNETNRIFHRGGLFGTLTVTFPDSVTIKKHTSDLGFLPEVSSENPWRPGAWREFRLVTRSLDSIYTEYTPEAIQAEIIVEVRDPLKFGQRKTLAEFSVPWQTLMGAQVSGTAAVLEPITPISFEKAGVQQFQPGDLVTLTAQKGAGYKVLFNNDKVGWLPFRALAIDQEDFKVLPPSPFPKQVESESIKMVLQEWTLVDHPEEERSFFSATLRIENLHEKNQLQVRSVDFLMDFGPDDAPAGSLEIKSNEGFKTTTGTTLKPGSAETFRFLAPVENTGRPMELIWWPTPKIRLAVSLF